MEKDQLGKSLLHWTRFVSHIPAERTHKHEMNEGKNGPCDVPT